VPVFQEKASSSHLNYFRLRAPDRCPNRKYKILQRGETTFTLTEENDRSYEYKSDNPIETVTFELKSQMRGLTYYGYVITLTDKRGEVVQYEASNEWQY
jgi:hypothetical protein